MSLSTKPQGDIDRIISFWFDAEDPISRWFKASPEVDAQCKDLFGGLIEQARLSQLKSWTETPKGTLATLLLLDQFPRNVFRGSALSFSSDSMASDIAVQAIAKGQDRAVPLMQQAFFYLPLEHDESLIAQVAAVSMFEQLSHRCDPESAEGKFAKTGLAFAERHRGIIMRFGRFPGRNAALGRESTAEEVDFLKESPSGL
ncbi:MAG: hypothetical protein M1818_006288 [Claussenomyces sp. TS43310]|nr:MAG: hypothetical protein M1818_006288 [Claussenomyces sp. TS43310]